MSPPAIDNLLIENAISSFLIGYFSTCKRSPKTHAAYSSDLGQFAGAFASTRLTEMTPDMVERWAACLREKGYAPASVRRKLASVTVFFNYWVRRRTLERSPLWQLRLDVGARRTLTRVLSEAEVHAILLCARTQVDTGPPHESLPIDRGFMALRNLALVELMFATGLRVGEVASLSTNDIMEEQRAIVVKGKGDRQRLAFLVDEHSHAAMKRYFKCRTSVLGASPALFLSSLGRSLSTQGIANLVRALATKAGIERRVTPHMFRHTIATLLLKNGADIRIVQEFLGHASISTTQRYTHVVKEHLLARLRLTHPNILSPRPRLPSTAGTPRTQADMHARSAG